MKKIFLLFFASLLVLSCTKDAELADSSADLSTTLAQYDDTNMGIYKGVFTTQGTMERGTLEISITPNNYGVATLNLVSGQVINFRADRTIDAGAELQDLVFSSSSVIASFKLSADLDGKNVQISDVMYKGITSGAIAIHETSRAPVTPITGVLACDDCDAHPLMVTGDTGTFSLVFAGDGSADDTVLSLADVGVVVATPGAQEGCADNGDGTTSCNVSGFGTIGGNDISFDGTHSYNNGGDCSSAAGGWTLDSTNHGNFGGTFTSDTASCAPPANDTCAGALPIACGDTVSGDTSLATNTGADTCTTTWTAPDVYYTFTDTGVAQDVILFTCDQAGYDTKISVFSGACGALVCVAGNDDGPGCADFSSTVEFQTSGDGTTVYTVVVHGFNSSTGIFDLSMTCTDAPVPTCTDGIQNGDETGIDCGGSVCPPCAATDFVPDCGDTAWTDDGGAGGTETDGDPGNYAYGTDTNWTVDAGAGNVVTADFAEFSIEATWDFMYFYDGATTADTPILTSNLGTAASLDRGGVDSGFTGGDLLADGVTSSGQFLTIRFISDTSQNRPGWSGQVDCSPPPPASEVNNRVMAPKRPATQTAQEIADKKAYLRKMGYKIK
ncbi:MAG: CUB domain-containing protein [Flavobacteriaceae bacterium]|nr:CUB domain-containing protein [Flavobacteriaceae bacterium]